jgi:two-component system, OmpR family, phosphate regulon response regulator PhoB
MSVVLPDLILLNRMLPGTEGGSFARQLRENMHTRNVPFIMLGACKNERRDLHERYSDLDDCVARPSQQEELISRVAAVLRQRRIPRLSDEAVSINGLSLEPSSRRVLMSVRGAKLVLHVGPTELRLLYFFMTHPDRVYSRTDLLEHVWGGRDFLNERSVDSYVKRLRASLRPGACDHMIESVRGFGYRFALENSSHAK